MSNRINMLKTGVVKTHLLGIPAETKTCQTGSTIKTFAGSDLTVGDVHKIRLIYRSRGNGSPTSSLCSSIGAAFYETSWKWSISAIWTSSENAYAQMGKLQDKTGTFTITSTHVASTKIAMTLYWLVQNYYKAGNDSQTHDLYYAKYWNATTGEIYFEEGDAEQNICPINVEDFMEE